MVAVTGVAFAVPDGSVTESDGTVVLPNGFRLRPGKRLPRRGGWQTGSGVYTAPPVYKRNRFGDDVLEGVRGRTKLVRDFFREQALSFFGTLLYGTALRVLEWFLDASGADLARAEVVMSQRFIADQLTVSRRSVGRAVRLLKRIGLLEVEHHERYQMGDDGRLVFQPGMAAGYRLAAPAEMLERLVIDVERAQEFIAKRAKKQSRRRRREQELAGEKPAKRDHQAEAQQRARRIRAAVKQMTDVWGEYSDEDSVRSWFAQHSIDGELLSAEELECVAIPAYRSITGAPGPP